MIKAIMLDVDGIIVGEKIGFNSPYPHHDALVAMKRVRQQGIPIILCTAKPHYSISKIIKNAELNNLHITDAGAVIIDPIDNIIVKEYTINASLAKKVLQTLLSNNVYSEFYTTGNYFIAKSQQSEITKKHSHILQHEPQLLDDFVTMSENYHITKIMPIAKDISDKQRVTEILNQFEETVSISWGVHPIALPLQFCIITAKGSSKKEAAKAVVENLQISFSDVLGIGDSTSDWSFMQLCGYGATLANGADEIKKLIEQKGEGKFTIGKSVDENGILDVFKYFDL